MAHADCYVCGIDIHPMDNICGQCEDRLEKMNKVEAPSDKYKEALTLVGGMNIQQILESYIDLHKKVNEAEPAALINYRLYDTTTGKFVSQKEMGVSDWNDKEEWVMLYAVKQTREKILADARYSSDPNRFQVHEVEVRSRGIIPV